MSELRGVCPYSRLIGALEHWSAGALEGFQEDCTGCACCVVNMENSMEFLSAS